jgi:hypothetical protein
MSLSFFWVVTPRRLVGRYQRFGETFCLNGSTDTSIHRSSKHLKSAPNQLMLPVMVVSIMSQLYR